MHHLRTSHRAILLLSIFIGLWWFLVIHPPTVKSCSFDWNDKSSCYPSVYTINGAYCFNNGSGICKVFAGRFEFYYDTFRDNFIGPAPKSEFVDQFGYHKRVPVSYNITGHIIYADRSINWAKAWAPKQGKRISLLSSTSFNWCRLAVNNWWPYKSAVLDPTKRYHIYFYNRQSCIYDSQNPDTENAYQHFNTRFLHNTTIRIDLDMNPTIFSMEDNLATTGNKIRLVRHMRQHWYETEFNVLKQPSPELNYFVYMNSNETLPCKIDGQTSSFLPASAFKKFGSGRCMDDSIHLMRHGKNSPLFSSHCGVDQVEVSDLPNILTKFPNFEGSMVLEADLHNLPRQPPKSAEYFFGLNLETDEQWEEFARDGFTFSATTSIPIDNSTVRVLMLYADFKRSVPRTYSDEHYPLPMISDYTSKLILNPDNVALSRWESDRESKAQSYKTLNYVDDIAYLHNCKTVLVVLGPLYTQLPVDSFKNINAGAPVESIYNLGIFELTNSFFAMPDSNTLWVFHRTNYITDHKYKCNSGRDGLVTATKGSGKYYPRHGLNQPAFFHKYSGQASDHFEETFFKDMGVFKGSLQSPEAPDPALYPLGNEDVGEPVKPKDNTWIYIMVGIAILVILAMCIICMFAMRARRRRRRHGAHLSDPRTARSSFIDSILAPFSGMPTLRSSLKSRARGSNIESRLTDRTSLGSSAHSSSASHATRRSTLTQGRGSHSSGKTRRSGITLGSSRGKNTLKTGSSFKKSSSQRSGSGRARAASISSISKTQRSGSTTKPRIGYISWKTKQSKG